MEKRLQSYSAAGITVNFDPNLCYHSAICLKSLPAVFDVRRRKWIEPGASSIEEVVATVEKCPSGALTYLREGQAEQVSEEPAERPAITMIQVSKNGPLLVQGNFVLQDESGNVLNTPNRVALCRCGYTDNSPFCDGSHQRMRFTSRRRAED
jgi:uncharacterized Fe-S cluster protein YjdI/CDGSH-type Zn-finger protein